VPIRAVVFDYYLTLADAESVSCEPIGALLARRGHDADPEAVLRAWRTMRVPDVERALHGALPPFVTLHDRWRNHGAELLAGYGIDDGADDWAHCRTQAHVDAVLFDDVEPALAALRDLGMRLAVLSDADTATLHASIERCRLDLDAVVCSEDLRCYKPHRSLFDDVCARLDVAPADAMYVGDNARVDVVGARHAGMTAVWLNRGGAAFPDGLEPPHHTVTSLLELPALITS
jgi:putative hydrolase of the HAD superfamily